MLSGVVSAWMSCHMGFWYTGQQTLPRASQCSSLPQKQAAQGQNGKCSLSGVHILGVQQLQVWTLLCIGAILKLFTAVTHFISYVSHSGKSPAQEHKAVKHFGI